MLRFMEEAAWFTSVMEAVGRNKERVVVSLTVDAGGSALALVEEVVRDLSDLIGLRRDHTQTMLDHKLRMLVAVDENDLLASNPFNEVHRTMMGQGWPLVREPRRTAELNPLCLGSQNALASSRAE